MNISRNKRRRDLQSNLSAFKNLNPRVTLAKGCLKGKDAQKPLFGTNNIHARVPTIFDTCILTLIPHFSLLSISQNEFYLRHPSTINIFKVLGKYMDVSVIRCFLYEINGYKYKRGASSRKRRGSDNPLLIKRLYDIIPVLY